MRLRTALPASLAVLGVALTGGSITAATASSQSDSADRSRGGMHGHAMQRSEMRQMHRSMMRNAEMREMHRTMMRDPEMRRMHRHMMSMGCGMSGMSMHR